MAGNVREWVWDYYDRGYYHRAPYENPKGPLEVFDAKSLRGGGFNDPKNRLRTYHRLSHDPHSPGYNRGFRCVKSP